MSAPGPESIPTSADKRSHRPLKKRKMPVPKSPTSLQAANLASLLANPDQEIKLPPPVETLNQPARKLPPPPEIVTNVQGSSAGAGSGEFHVYKAARRREYERLRLMDEEVAREKAKEEFERSKHDKETKDEERTRKNREKREKKRLKQEEAARRAKEEKKLKEAQEKVAKKNGTAGTAMTENGANSASVPTSTADENRIQEVTMQDVDGKTDGTTKTAAAEAAAATTPAPDLPAAVSTNTASSKAEPVPEAGSGGGGGPGLLIIEDDDD